jgi:transaldolase
MRYTENSVLCCSRWGLLHPFYIYRRRLFMKFFVDTAKIEDIKKANDMGVICGVTTNPSLIAKEGGKSQEEVLKEIASIVDDRSVVKLRQQP